MEFFETLKHRRSIRRFLDRQIEQEKLEMLLKAANAAPVGSNMYEDVHISVVQNRDIMKSLARAATLRWSDKEKVKEIIGKTKNLEMVNYDPFYAAPTLIIVSHREQDLQPGIEYANVTSIVNTMHLAATSLGLASVYSWFAFESMIMIPELDTTEVLHLPDGFRPLLGLAVGYPAGKIVERELSLEKIDTDFIK